MYKPLRVKIPAFRDIYKIEICKIINSGNVKTTLNEEVILRLEH